MLFQTYFFFLSSCKCYLNNLEIYKILIHFNFFSIFHKTKHNKNYSFNIFYFLDIFGEP